MTSRQRTGKTINFFYSVGPSCEVGRRDREVEKLDFFCKTGVGGGGGGGGMGGGGWRVGWGEGGEEMGEG